MASLADLKKSLNVIDITDNIDDHKSTGHAFGKKRRPWVEDEEDGQNKREQHVSSNVSVESESREQNVSSNQKSSMTHEQHVSESLSEKLAKKQNHVSNMYSGQKQHVRNKTIHHDLSTKLLSLSGHEKKLIRYIFKQCQASANLETNLISSNDICEYLQINTPHLRNLIYRLSKKDLISVTFFQKNKSGLRKFLIDKDVFDKLNYDDNIINSLISREQHESNTVGSREQLVDNNKSNKLADTSQLSPSSSSLNKLTTNAEVSESQESFVSDKLPDEWDTIDFSSLEQIGFNHNKLQQIYQSGKLSAEMVQDSIYAYAFDMEVNQVKHHSPINFIMSQLKVKGIPYEFPSNYESPQDRALRRYIEQKKAQRERSQQLHELLKQEAFEEWLKNLPDEEQEKLVPSHQYAPGTHLRRAALATHYNKHIWPEKEKTVLAAVTQ